MSTALNIAAFVVASAGAWIAMAGSLRMAQAYHPFTAWDFVRHIARVAWLYARHDKAAARRLMMTTTEAGSINTEDRVLSLAGLYLVFCGFAAQLLGGLLALASSLISAAK